MTKEKFLQLLKNPERIITADLQELEQLVEMYPYCYAFHVLVAKAYGDLGASGYQHKLNKAAILAPNRIVLKAYIQHKVETDEKGLSESLVVEQVEDKEESVLVAEPQPEPTISSSTNDITFDQREQHEKDEPEDHVSHEDPHHSINEFLETSVEIDKEQETENLYKELEENMRVLKERMNHVNSQDAETSFTPEINIQEEAIISQLENKQDVKPDFLDEKQKRQYELIEKFIEEQPSFVRMTPYQNVVEENEDLSAPSSVIGDDLVSENLAIILIRQGKVDAAIDIYKKLIWKFPQKKTYFADRIEELKRNI